MSSKRYTDQFKMEAVRQVTDRDFKVAEVAERLGVTTHSLYACLRNCWRSAPTCAPPKRSCMPPARKWA